LRRALACFAAVVIVCAAPAPAAAQLGIAVAPDESVAGLSQAEWSQAWWQWAGSFERRTSPVADSTGERCGSNQSGPVWFLAGTYGTQRVTRVCRVPRGAYLFFPLINYVVMSPRDSPSECPDSIRQAALVTDGADSLSADLDGQRVADPKRHRQATDCFDMGARAGTPYPIYPSAANGYYVMLRPLSVGTHELNFGGVLPSMTQAVTYMLIVE
jgi:hypothetical protein